MSVQVEVSRRLRADLLKTSAISFAAVVLAASAGCEVGPDYKAPDSHMTAFHNRLDVNSQSAVGAPLDQWWTGFDDAELTRIVHRALEQNLDLAASIARVQQARAAAASAGAQLLPTADLDANATWEHQSLLSPLGEASRYTPGYSRYQREYSVGAAASWEIDIAGGLRRGAAAARAEAEAAEADQLGTRITVAADAADAYLQIRGYQSRIAVANDQIDTDAHLLELVNVRQRVGAADDREVAEAEAIYKEARSVLPVLRTALEAQLNRLDVLLGAQPGTYAKELSAAGSIPGIPAISNAGESEKLLRRRPDIIAAERRLAASNERIGLALSDYYPKVSVSGLLGFDGSGANHLFNARAFQPAGVAGLRWRLFDFGKVDAEVAQARGANGEALALYRQSVLKAAQDVENALTALSQTEIRREELEGQVAALIRVRDLSERAYKAGAITLTDVLDADRELLVARDNLDSTRADSARAAVETFRALGGGWTIPAAQTRVGLAEATTGDMN